MVAETRRMTVAEYLAFERASEQRHAFHRGEIYAMSGASRVHNLITTNIVRLVGNALLEKPCEIYTNDMRVRVGTAGDYTYPDVVTVCGAPEFEDAHTDTLLNPTVIVEVLSDSTERYDRGRKFELYRTIASLTEYVLVSQRVAIVEHYTRRAEEPWTPKTYGPGEVVPLHGGECPLQVDACYAKVFPRGGVAEIE